MVETAPDPARVVERLRAHRHGSRLLTVLDDRGGIHLVGGAVRDLLLDREPSELDLLVDGDAVEVARSLREALGGRVTAHPRFGTAVLDAGDGMLVDLAGVRAESYARPGALPDVRPSSVEEDMARRDFTVNAIAVGISPDVLGAVHHAPHAPEDLAARRLRVLHDASFIDDPTRLVRLARYAARLGFAVEEETERLARAAFASRAPRTAGEARMGHELLLLAREPDPVEALVRLLELAGEAGVEPGLEADPALLRAALDLLPEDGRHDLLVLAGALRHVDRATLRDWVTAVHVPDAGVVLDATDDPEGLARAMREARRPSDLRRVLRRRTPEAVALAGALGAEDAARTYLDEVRNVRLQITGDDVLAAGVPRGPEVGRRLEAALARKLDEGLATPEEELAAAMEEGAG